MMDTGTHIQVKKGDVLRENADALVCSANVFLNLSGGVGGEILLRHGVPMQEALHNYLSARDINFVKQGDVVRTDGFGTGFKHVLHAVAVNGWYECSAQAVKDVLTNALKSAAALGSNRVAMVAVGTGYGRLGMKEFAVGLQGAVCGDYSPVEVVTIVVPHEEDAETIRSVLCHVDV